MKKQVIKFFAKMNVLLESKYKLQVCHDAIITYLDAL